MGYLDIRSRENIDAIMGETLSEYFHTKVTVADQYRRGCFILCPRLNTAVYDRAEKSVKRTVQRSHAVQSSPLLKLAMAAFISVAFSKHGMFGCKYIIFDRTPEHAESMVILPGNMKIKIFDFQEGTVRNILKTGFEKTSLQIEKNIRIDSDRAYILSLRMEQESVYCEDLIQGRSYDRLEPKLADALLGRIEDILLDIQQGDRKTVGCVDYMAQQMQDMRRLLSQLHAEQALKKQVLSFAEQMCGYGEGEIVLSDSHGDFQNGNIFVSDDGKIYILDWETCATRSIGYDLLTFFYKFRYRADYLMRIDSFLNDECWAARAQKYGVLFADKRVVLSIYFIEDIIWLLQEILSTPEKRCSDGIRKYSELEFQRDVIERLEKCE